MQKKLHQKIQTSIPCLNDNVVKRIVAECTERMEWLECEKDMLIQDNVAITFNNDTKEIDIRQNEMFGIFWSFNCQTGELVGT